MEKWLDSIRKEWWILITDKVGLILLFIMPIAMVFIVTLVQNSSFEIANAKRLNLVIANTDTGEFGDSLVQLMKGDSSFNIVTTTNQNANKKILEDHDALVLIKIPESFSDRINTKAKLASNKLTNVDQLSSDEKDTDTTKTEIRLMFTSQLQPTYRQTIEASVKSKISEIESKALLKHLYSKLKMDKKSNDLNALLFNSTVELKEEKTTKSLLIPTATQHNVPAWTLFALFFIVTSLGTTIVRERHKGSYIRLRTIPTSYRLVIFSKICVYLLVALLQTIVIFSIGVLVFPLIDLPELNLPSNPIPLITVVILSSLCAINYAVLVGVFSKTVEQANGYGAISIIIFAAIGGIWVPSFIMPDYMKTIGMISPMQWCLEGFYKVFLEDAGFKEMQSILCYFGVFILVTTMLIRWKLIKLEKE